MKSIYRVNEPKHKKVCEMCKEEFFSYQINALTCSSVCRKNRINAITGRLVLNNNNLSSGTVGAMCELLVSADLMQKGFAVFRAMSPSCFCDLIAVKGDKILRVEVRTGYKNMQTGNFQFPLKLSVDKNNKADCYGIYERNEKKIYYLTLDKNVIDI